MSPHVTEAFLANCPLFRGMSASERQELLDLMQCESFSGGQTLIHEGRSTQMLWIILSGSCQVLKHTKTGGEQILASLEKCGVFGEMSFFNPAPHSASVRSVTQVELLRLPREKYDGLLESKPSAAQKLAFNTIAVLSERLRVMDEWTCELVDKAEAGRHRDEWHDFRAKLYSDWQF
jgi:CRP/FNR family transcriptional regulator, cyclic AMP receptor protein